MQSNSDGGWTRGQLRRKSLINIIWLSALALLAAASVAAYTRLNIQIDSIMQKKIFAQSERDELALEVKRMERLIEYSKMNEYRQQLAVDKLGYVGPDDIKFVQAQDEDTRGAITAITEDDY